MSAGYSDVKPVAIDQVNGVYQFRYNLLLVPESEDKPAIWQYDYVESDVLDRKVLIDKLISVRFSYASQLGKLALSRNSAEWAEYNAFRLECISVVDKVFDNYG